ncbi:MAG: hypothetical protein A2017_07205 [Lentisphaerae bacterium GWF2_44_16]|nr:MAG: hypothetical protein A2017_07205 [Lentisphaerae bacterium GWF2_44_16]
MYPSKKCFQFSLFTLIICSFACFVYDVNGNEKLTWIFDPGGVSVDFSSRTIEENIGTRGGNLLPNSDFSKVDEKTLCPAGWYSKFHVHDSTREELRKQIDPLTVRKVIEENGKKAIFISTPEEAFKLRGGKNPQISNYYSCNVDIGEQSENTKYVLSFNYRGKFLPVPDTNFLDITVLCLQADKKNLKTFEFFLDETVSWKRNNLTFIAPKGTKSLLIYFKLYGCGELAFSDLELKQGMAESGVTVRLIPFSFLDNIFCMTSGKVGILSFSCRNEKEVKVEKPELILEVPEGIIPLEPKAPMKIKEKTEFGCNGKKYLRYRIDIAPVRQSFFRDKYGTWDSIYILMETSLPTGKICKGRYWYEDKDYKTNPMEFNIRIIPYINGKTPSLFETGIEVGKDFDYQDRNNIGKLSAFYKDAGFNAIHCSFTPENAKEFFNRNIKIYNPLPCFCDGYRLGIDPKPENAKFRFQDGTVPKLYGKYEAICPIEVYNEGPYFRESILKLIEDVLVKNKRASEIMPNWEPHMFNFKGCFCENCKKEFIKYSALSENEINAAWPKDIILKYRDIWVKFRSWQHARLVSTLEKNINDIGRKAGTDSHFVPQIAWSFLTENGNKDCQQYNPVDFIDDLPVLEPWGPYIFYDFSKPYVYNTGIHIRVFATARAIKDFVAEKVKDKSKQPKLIAMPHSFQCDTWVTEPEALAFDTLSFFLNGWEGSLAYYFPKGYDARYWNAMAKTNMLIAEYENYVFKGKRLDSFTVSPLTPLPSCNWAEGGNFKAKLKMLNNSPVLVQGVEYELNGSRMIALGNFWQKGEAFVKLSINGLNGDKKYVILQPDLKIAFASDNGKVELSAKELQDGIIVHIGALRFAFFIVEEYSSSVGYGTVIKADDMKKFMDSRISEIKKAMDFENKYLADAKQKEAAEKQDYASLIKNLKSDMISLNADKDGNGNTVMAVKAGISKILIDLVHGGRISSWNADGNEIVSANDKLGMAVDAFWWPEKAANMITTPYTIEKQDLKPDLLTVTVRKKITADESTELSGLKMIKTYRIPSSGNEISVSTEILNSSDKEKSFSFRYHNMLSYMGDRNGKSGFANVIQNGMKQKFERIFSFKLFRFSKDKDNELEKVFPPDNMGFIDSCKIEFCAPWTKTKLDFDVLKKEDLYGLIFWDSGTQKASTFEPLFKRVTLKPGEKHIFGFSMLFIE